MEGITSRSITNSSGVASAEETRTAFDELWLAEFLTGDDLTALACVIDTRARRHGEYEIGQDGSWTWRSPIVRCTFDLLGGRITQLASAYERRGCFVRRYVPRFPEAVDLPVIQCDALRLRLDVLCRFVLVLCGVEQRSVDDAALVLGVSRNAIQAAYSDALEVLEIMTCEAILESNGCAAALN